MQALLDVRFHGMAPSPSLQGLVASELEQLSAVYPITYCHVTVDQPHRHANTREIQVMVDVRGPGFDFAVRDGTGAHGHDAYQLVSQLFSVLRRRLQDREGKARANLHDTVRHA